MPSESLCLIESAVCGRYEIARIASGSGCKTGYADAHRCNAERAHPMLQAQLGHFRTDSFGHVERRPGVKAREQNCKLLPAVTRGEVARSAIERGIAPDAFSIDHPFGSKR
jgi:hypothetical protein